MIDYLLITTLDKTCEKDNTISIWRVHDWVCVHILGGHKAAVNDLAVHPSGKLALSVSKDSTLKLWNLVQGLRRHARLPNISLSLLDARALWVHTQTEIAGRQGPLE